MAVKTYLITGGAGFIGSNLIKRLLADENNRIICFDNFDNFYSPEVKRSNIRGLLPNNRFQLIEGDICNFNDLKLVNTNIDVLVHLAAKVGVRPSIKDPNLYLDVNVLGTQNVLDFAKEKKITQIVFASSSSVYGINPDVPWSEKSSALEPISPYAASKIWCENIGHVYSKLYGIRFIALRFFTVYGPGQRPDLAIHKFVKSILNNQSIPVYGDGSTKRDYTFIDDIVEGIVRATEYRDSDFEIFNLGNETPISLMDLIIEIEKAIGQKAQLNYLPMQEGDVPMTYASIEKSKNKLGYNPKTPMNIGLNKFYNWYKNIHDND